MRGQRGSPLSGARRQMRRLVTALAAALSLPVAMTAAGGAAPAPAHADDAAAAVQCNVDYKTNDWGSGFTADLTISNPGTEATNGWTLTYDYAGNQKLGNGWNGTRSRSGKTVTVKNAAHNANIAAGGNVTTGAQFSYSGTNTALTAFAVNGVTCRGKLRHRLRDLHRDRRRSHQGRGHRHPTGRRQDVRHPLPGAVQQDRRSLGGLLLARGHPVPLRGDPDRRGPRPGP